MPSLAIRRRRLPGSENDPEAVVIGLRDMGLPPGEIRVLCERVLVRHAETIRVFNRPRLGAAGYAVQSWISTASTTSAAIGGGRSCGVVSRPNKTHLAGVAEILESPAAPGCGCLRYSTSSLRSLLPKIDALREWGRISGGSHRRESSAARAAARLRSGPVRTSRSRRSPKRLGRLRPT